MAWFMVNGCNGVGKADEWILLFDDEVVHSKGDGQLGGPSGKADDRAFVVGEALVRLAVDQGQTADTPRKAARKRMLEGVTHEMILEYGDGDQRDDQ
jgi:hypothetical protein